MVKFYIKGISIVGNLITVDYEIILSNDNFEGAIGGGRTELPLPSFEISVDSLKKELEDHLETHLGIQTFKSQKSKTQDEEDPL